MKFDNLNSRIHVIWEWICHHIVGLLVNVATYFEYFWRLWRLFASCYCFYIIYVVHWLNFKHDKRLLSWLTCEFYCFIQHLSRKKLMFSAFVLHYVDRILYFYCKAKVFFNYTPYSVVSMLCCLSGHERKKWC